MGFRSETGMIYCMIYDIVSKILKQREKTIFFVSDRKYGVYFQYYVFPLPLRVFVTVYVLYRLQQ